MGRVDTRIRSGDSELATWDYAPSGATGTRPCVVMAHGFSLTRHDGLAPFAEQLAEAGARVLVFDHRFLGDSGGEPRQHFSKREQLRDWASAIAFARGLRGVDPSRIVLWGYSFSGGHVTTIAARDRGLAAAVVLCPFLDGLHRVLSVPPATSARILPKAVLNLTGRPVLIPVTGPVGSVAAMSLAGEEDGFRRTIAADSPWRNEIAPGVFATVALHRPLRLARRIACPLWVGLGERDISVSPKAVERLAARAPQAELRRYDYDHFEPFQGQAPERIAADQLDFLRRHGVL